MFKTGPITPLPASLTKKSFKVNRKIDLNGCFGIPHSKCGPLTASIVQHLICRCKLIEHKDMANK